MQSNYFIQNIHMFNYCCLGILLTCHWNERIYGICTSLVKIVICLWCHIEFSHIEWAHNFTRWYSPFLCIFVCVIYIFSSKTLYKWMFWLKLLSCKGSEFYYFLDLWRVKRWDKHEQQWCPLLMVSTSAFHAIIFRYFDICEGLQRVNSVTVLPC